jgi:hypothetical protein
MTRDVCGCFRPSEGPIQFCAAHAREYQLDEGLSLVTFLLFMMLLIPMLILLLWFVPV